MWKGSSILVKTCNANTKGCCACVHTSHTCFLVCAQQHTEGIYYCCLIRNTSQRLKLKLGMVTIACSLSSLEAEAGGWLQV